MKMAPIPTKKGGLRNRVSDMILQAYYTTREDRAVRALRSGPIMREALDRVIGCSNSPDVIMRLRRRGFTIICERVERDDRDGHPCYPGKYRLISEPEAD